MYRDVNGRFVAKSNVPNTNQNSPKETVKADYGYYSKLLNKPFDSLEELTAAEADFKAKEAEKQQKSADKKADAALVEESFKALTEVKKSAAESIASARKSAAAEIDEVRKKWSAVIEAANEDVAKAERMFNETLKVFQEKYKQGYHMTLRDNDTTMTIDTRAVDTIGLFNDLFAGFFPKFF